MSGKTVRYAVSGKRISGHKIIRNRRIYIREPLKTHLREKELLAPTASSSLLTLRGLPGSGEVSSLRDRGADRQTSKLSEPFLAFGAIISFSLFKAVFRGTHK